MRATSLEGLFAAVTRKTLDDGNAGGRVPEPRVKVEDALKAYTQCPTCARFEENMESVLAPGGLADFDVLDQNRIRIPRWQIRDVRTVPTVVAGRVVHQARWMRRS